MATAQVLGSYGYAPGNMEAEGGLASAAPPETNLNISVYPAIRCYLTIWVPLVSCSSAYLDQRANVEI